MEESGIRCWISPRDILPSEIWAESIANAIRKSRIFVLVFSEYSNSSTQVSKELALAIKSGLSIFPFKISETNPKGVFEYYLSDTHWLDAINKPIEDSINNLIEISSFILKNNDTANYVLNCRWNQTSSRFLLLQKKFFWYGKIIVNSIEVLVLLFTVFLFIVFIYCNIINDWRPLLPYFNLLEPVAISLFFIGFLGIVNPKICFCKKRISVFYLIIVPMLLISIVAGNSEEQIKNHQQKNKIENTH